jgi:hypothetical protein
MESYFLCCVCGSLECSAIDVDLCTRCGRRYGRAHRRTHRCYDSEAPDLRPLPPGDLRLRPNRGQRLTVGDETATTSRRAIEF